MNPSSSDPAPGFHPMDPLAGRAQALEVPESPEQWEARRHMIRHELWSLLGKLPDRQPMCPVEVLTREDRGEYFLEKLRFDNGTGAVVPGYFLLPKADGQKAPAILYCHWHGQQYDLGKEEIFRAEHTPEAPGPALARRGFAVLAIDACCFGERNGLGVEGSRDRDAEGEWTAAKWNLWHGRTLWGMILRDDLLALDYLMTRPEIDGGRVGVTGMSMGATRSWWLMALDDRIQTGVAVSCLTRYEDLIQAGALKEHGIYYFVPDMLNHFDTEVIVSLIAPRPVLFLNGDHDPGSPAGGIRKIEEKARSVYRLYRQEQAFQSVIYPGVGHVYTQEMWQRMLAWFEQPSKPPEGAPEASAREPQS